MKRKLNLSISLILLTVLLSACGKKTTPTAQADTTPSPTETVQTVTPTPEAVKEVKPLRAIWNGFQNVLRSGNMTVNTELNFEQNGESAVYRGKKCVIVEEDCVRIYYEAVDANEERGIVYALYKSDGGVYAKGDWDPKEGLDYEMKALPKKDAELLYPIFQELKNPEGKPVEKLCLALNESYPGWADQILQDDESFEKKVEAILTLFDDEEKLTSILGFREEAKGKYVFHFNPLALPLPDVEEFLKNETVRKLLLYFYSYETDKVNDMTVTVTMDGENLASVIIECTTSQKVKKTDKVVFSDVGKTEIFIPEVMRDDFNDACENYANMKEQLNLFELNRQDFDDYASGRMEKDTEILDTIYYAYEMALQNESLNKKIYDALKGKEKVINYSNGVKIADTGIPELDKAFAEVFHDQTFKQESARYEDRVFQIMLSPGDDGVVTFYWHLE